MQDHLAGLPEETSGEQGSQGDPLKIEVAFIFTGIYDTSNSLPTNMASQCKIHLHIKKDANIKVDV